MANKPKEEQQGRILDIKHFDLKSFKFNKDKGLDIVYFNMLFPNAQEEPKSKIVTHPDLKEKMNQLKLHYATKLGLIEGWDFAREHVKKTGDALKLAMEGHKAVLDRIKITGLTFAGEGETYGVSITAYVKFPKKGGSGISSGKITFGSDDLGYEEDVKSICEEIKDEVYKYRFQNKKAQLDIETEAEKAEQAGMFDESNNDAK